MDVGESVFKRMANWWRRRAASRERDRAARNGEATLAPHKERFEILAALLAGQVLDVRAADDDLGGVSGATLLLPKRIQLSDDPGQNVALYLARIAFSCASWQCGFALPPASGDAFATTIATLLAVPHTLAYLAAHYPSAHALHEQLSPLCLRARPAASSSGETLGALLEGWTRCLLGEPEPLRALSPAAQAAVRAAASRAPTSAEELAEAAREVRESLARVASAGLGSPPPFVALWGRLYPPARALPSTELGSPPDLQRIGERKAIQLDRTIRLQRRKHEKTEDRPLYHMFEKVETAEEYEGDSGTPDASGNIEDMKEALDELALGTAIRSTEDPRNLARAELVMEDNALEVAGERLEPAARAFKYPEWNFKKQRYEHDHCTVIEERYVSADASAGMKEAREALRAHQRQVEDLRAHLLRSLYRRRLRNRQLDGAEIDVEAIVERHADLCAGRTPPERLYLAARKALREVAILVLVDLSFSTDAWVEGRRVLDVEMQSLLVLAEAFSGHLEEEVAVATFRSNTRHDVRYGVLKGFDDSWDVLRASALGLAPAGYTRIGAALRHASSVLDASRARRKLLLLVSDGKPTDYDRYEGTYGVEDVAQAVREASQRQIRVFGLAIEREAKLHLARMLGAGNYRILPRTALLPEVMAEVFVGALTG